MSFCPEPRGGQSQRPARPVPTPLAAVVAALCLAVGAAPASAQQRELTVADIFDPARRVDFDGNPPRGLEWLDDRHYLQPAGHGGPPLKVEAESGAGEPLFDAAALETAIAGVPGIDAMQAGRLARSSHLLNGSRTALVFDFDNDLYYHALGGSEVTRLTRTPEAEQEVSFSPDGRLVAFVREHDLHVVSVDRPQEHALTSDGSDAVRNGVLDWVYQEEIYGRGNFRGYWWSPDSTRIAFLRLDGSEVPEFTIVDHIEYHPEVERWSYPKAGDPNPVVRLGIASAGGGDAAWVDLEAYAGSQPLIVSVGWTPDGGRVVYQVQDREQTWLDLNVAEPGSGRPTKLLRETTEAWVNVNGPPLWLADGSFLWLSERSGWKHLYHYRADGALVRQVTSGEWEVRRVHGVDEQAGWIYWSGTERSPIGSDAYRVRLDGSGLTRLTARPGTHRVQFNPGFTRYIDTWEQPGRAAPGAAARGGRRRAARHRRERGHRPGRVRPVDAGAAAGAEPRRLPHGSADDQAAGLRPGAPLLRLPARLRRPARPARARRVERIDIPVLATARAAGRDRVGARQPHGQRQGRRVDLGPSTRTSERASCATSRTGSTGWRRSRTSTRTASASRAGATAASW